MYSYSEIFKDKRSILFVVAHPDDLEAYYGGLVARLTMDDKKVSVLLCSNGSAGKKAKSTSGTNVVLQRLNEEKKALEILGVREQNFYQLELADGRLSFLEDKLLEGITGVIRKCKPDIICTHDPNLTYYYSKKLNGYFINHRDHRSVGLCVVDAVYPYARTSSFFEHQISNENSTHELFNLLLTSAQYPNPNAKIDITDVIEIKRRSMLSHKSQFSKDLVDQIIDEDNKTGRKYFEYGKFINLLY